MRSHYIEKHIHRMGSINCNGCPVVKGKTAGFTGFNADEGRSYESVQHFFSGTVMPCRKATITVVRYVFVLKRGE